MKCSICGTPIAPGTDRCPTCGCRYRSTYTTPYSSEERYNSYDSFESGRKTRRKNSGCCCAAAVLIPIVLFLLFIIAAAMSALVDEFTIRTPEMPPVESAPYTEALPETASEDCFTIENGTVMFLSDRWDGSTIVHVPETVAGQTVTAIGEGCFMDCEDLTTIVLPGTVTDIGPMAFSGCRELRGLFVPEAVESIGKEAFSGCLSLEAIYIPASVDHIASGCFDDCASLLYIFYGGMYEQWREVYNDYITPHTTAICLDGNYYHGVQD